MLSGVEDTDYYFVILHHNIWNKFNQDLLRCLAFVLASSSFIFICSIWFEFNTICTRYIHMYVHHMWLQCCTVVFDLNRMFIWNDSRMIFQFSYTLIFLQGGWVEAIRWYRILVETRKSSFDLGVQKKFPLKLYIALNLKLAASSLEDMPGGYIKDCSEGKCEEIVWPTNSHVESLNSELISIWNDLNRRVFGGRRRMVDKNGNILN